MQVDGSQAEAWLMREGDNYNYSTTTSSFHMESKPKEDNYLTAVSVSMLLYPLQNYLD